MAAGSEPSPTELLDAILALHAFTERGLGRLDAEIKAVESRLNAKTDTLRYDMNRRFDRVDERFDRVDERLDRVEIRLDRVEVRLDRVEVRLDRVEVRLDGMEGRRV